MPDLFRGYLTEGMQFMTTQMGIYDPTLQRRLAHAGTPKVVDLCSGSSGPWLRLGPALERSGVPLHLTLTDLYPNTGAYVRLCDALGDHVTFSSESVNALDVRPISRAPERCSLDFTTSGPTTHGPSWRTRSDSQAIGVFEFTHRSMFTISTGVFASALAPVLVTPFMRPLTAGRLFWTYLVPVVPVLSMWDGTVSHLRTYTPAELIEMTSGLAGYTWEAAEVSGPLPGAPLTYLIGWPSDQTPTSADLQTAGVQHGPHPVGAGNAQIHL